MFTSTAFVLGVVFDLIAFVVLVMAVITVFDISKRSKVIERRLMDLQQDCDQIKQSLLPSTRKNARDAQAGDPLNSSDA